MTSPSMLGHPPSLGLQISLAIGMLFYVGALVIVDHDAGTRFAVYAGVARNTISARIKSYTDALRGSASLFQTSENITREQFRSYVEGLSLTRYFPALKAINYAEYVPCNQVEQFQRRVRAEQAAHPFGKHVFSIHPPREHADHKHDGHEVLTFIEGEQIANEMFGFDILSVPHAVQAVLEARDRGVLVTSGNEVKAISSPNRIGLAMRLPVYMPGMPLATIADRRAAYIGSAGIAFSVPELVNGVLDQMVVKNVRMVLTDNGVGTESRNNLAARIRVLFDSSVSDTQSSPPYVPPSDVFTKFLYIGYNGRNWTATFTAPKASLYSQFDGYFPWLAMVSGTGGMILIYALFHALASSRSRAIRLANDMTSELRESQAKLKLSHQKLRSLVAHADQIKEGERKRIAREIHDDLGQNLLALRIEADLLASRTQAHHPKLHTRVRLTLSQIDATIKSVRQIINDLRPNVLDLGLSAAVEWQIAEFIRRTGIECKLIIGSHDIMLTDSCATAFFRILQESLTNIVRHANASAVRVELSAHNGNLSMSINDNGVGLPGGGRNKPGSFGLVGIEERISILGGSFSIASVEGDGTTVCVSVPISTVLANATSAAFASTHKSDATLI